MIVGTLTGLGSVVGLGKLGGAIGQGFVNRAMMAREYDQARAPIRGLVGGTNISGAGLGFSPTETQAILLQAAQAGLNPADTQQVGNIALRTERAGIGAGVATGFGGAFRVGGGAVAGPAGIGGQMGLAMAEAFQSGLQMAGVPDYLEKLLEITTSQADRGIDMSPEAIVSMAAALRNASNQAASFQGTRSLGVAQNFVSAAQEVAAGGGNEFQKITYLRAAGYGNTDADGRRIGLLEAQANLEAGRFDMGAVIGGYTKAAGGARAGAFMMVNDRSMSNQQAVDFLRGRAAGGKLSPTMTGVGGGKFIESGAGTQELLAERGMSRLANAAGAATSGTMRTVAGTQAADLQAGLAGMQAFADLEASVGAFTRSLDGGIGKAVLKAAGALGDFADFLGITDKEGKGPSILDQVKSWGGGGSTKKGSSGKSQKKINAGTGGTLRIEASPDVMRLFQFTFVDETVPV